VIRLDDCQKPDKSPHLNCWRKRSQRKIVETHACAIGGICPIFHFSDLLTYPTASPRAGSNTKNVETLILSPAIS